VNTWDEEHGREWLGSQEDLAGWLRERGLADGLGELDAADVAKAQRLRETLRELLIANNHERADAGAVDALNAAAGRAGLVPQLRDGALELVPLAGGIEGALGGVLASAFQAVAAGSWPRLKACRNHHCRWAFYDYSKNRSASWCSMQLCGNRTKTRAYRRRQRA
jgi:predicted RNA-binding Zn ribbon-like protein